MQYKQYNAPNINPVGQYEQRIALLENQVRLLNNTLKPFFVQGRLRTDRTVPVDSDDIQPPDQLYDWIVKDDYIYTVVIETGALKWRQIEQRVF